MSARFYAAGFDMEVWFPTIYGAYNRHPERWFVPFSLFSSTSYICNYISVTYYLSRIISGTIMTISKDRVKPSPLPDSWKLAEIFTTGVVLGSYLAMMTVIFFWAAYKTDFFPVLFFVHLVYHYWSLFLFKFFKLIICIASVHLVCQPSRKQLMTISESWLRLYIFKSAQSAKPWFLWRDLEAGRLWSVLVGCLSLLSLLPNWYIISIHNYNNNRSKLHILC